VDVTSAPTKVKEAAPDAPTLPAALSDRVGFLLAKTHLAARAAADPSLQPLGLDVRQFGALALLAGEGAMSQQALSVLQRCDRTTMVAVVDGLEAGGYVERRRNPDDRRAYALHITAAGRRALARAEKLVAEAEREFLAPLSPAEVRQLKDLLRRLLAH
jgi:DNA-binding MarR family transcriptional regulator